MRKRGQVVLAMVLALAALFVPMTTGLASGWRYSEDGNWGINILLPQEGQTIYTDEGFKFEFEDRKPDSANWDYVACLLYVDAAGNVDTNNIVKDFDVDNATTSSGSRWSIHLNVSDVQPGNYVFLFGIYDLESTQVAADYRNVTIAKRASGGWQKFSGGWSYSIDGSWVTNKWQLIGGKWYRFDSKGYMLTGWQKIGSSWYYLGTDGAMRTGWQAIGGKWYCFDHDGTMFSKCWLKSGGDWYMISSSGAMLTGWQKDGGNWYYMNPSTGKMHTGWLSLGGKWYFMDSGGRMVTGTGTIDGKRYTFNSSGVLVS